MTINTKFNVGDRAFVLYHSNLHEVGVIGISVRHSTPQWPATEITTAITYTIEFASRGVTDLPEKCLFPSKKALLASL